MKNKHLIIVILVVFLLIIGIIGTYLVLNNDNNDINGKIDTSENNVSKKSQNITDDSQINNSADNNIKSNEQKSKYNQNIKSTKPGNSDEPVLVTKKQAISKTIYIVNDINIGERVGNTAKLIKVDKKHYWVVPVYNKTNGLKTTDYYIDAKTGNSRAPYAL